MKVRVNLVLDVSPENWNREYNGKPEGTSTADIRMLLKQDAHDAVDFATRHLQPHVIRSIESKE